MFKKPAENSLEALDVEGKHQHFFKQTSMSTGSVVVTPAASFFYPIVTKEG
ncbi:MAG: hypothetical protein AAF298_16805 [Cyanobacteria bacterium P01_A01_bin.40]